MKVKNLNTISRRSKREHYLSVLLGGIVGSGISWLNRCSKRWAIGLKINGKKSNVRIVIEMLWTLLIKILPLKEFRCLTPQLVTSTLGQPVGLRNWLDWAMPLSSYISSCLQLNRFFSISLSRWFHKLFGETF